MIKLLVTYRSGKDERIDISDNHTIKDLRTHFLDPEGNFAASVEILGYQP